MHIKMKILNRFKKIENADYQNNQYNKQKHIENNNSDDSNKRKKNDENFVNEKEQLNKKTKQTITATKKVIRNSKSIILIENQWSLDCIAESKSNTQISKSRKNVSIAIIQNMTSKNAKTKKNSSFLKSLHSISKRQKTKRFDHFQSNWHNEKFLNEQ